MKRTAVGVLFLLGALTMASSCSSDPSSDSSTAKTLAGNGDGAAGVECTHPGAGKEIGGGRCACTTTRNVAGEWTALRTCSEDNACPVRNKEDTVVLTQNGTSVRLDRGGTYSVAGTLCGDVFVWSGGPKDGLNPECGQLRFRDDGHYLADSCYAANGACNPTFGQGCPGMKGQCAGTGAKKPEPATPIQRIICTQ